MLLVLMSDDPVLEAAKARQLLVLQTLSVPALDVLNEAAALSTTRSAALTALYTARKTLRQQALEAQIAAARSVQEVNAIDVRNG